METNTNTFKPIRSKSVHGRTSIALATAGHKSTVAGRTTYRITIDSRFKFHAQSLPTLIAAANAFHTHGRPGFIDFWHSATCTRKNCTGCHRTPALTVYFN